MHSVLIIVLALALFSYSYSFFDSTEREVSVLGKTAGIVSQSETLSRESERYRIDFIEPYTDPEFGFQMAVPVGWQRIVLAEDTTALVPELGYSVGFETDREAVDDRFADYILIEILPGADSGLFDSTADQRYSLIVDDQLVYYDKLYVDRERDQLSDVDLVIYQRELRGLGYTIDFFAIGEPANETMLFDAFQIMLRTFKQGAVPFSLS